MLRRLSDTPGSENNIFRWYRAEWGRYTQPDPLLTKPLRGRLVAPDLTDVYKYAGANPLAFTDPAGLAKKCASGDCPDCPSGFWTLTAASATVHAFFGGEAGVVTLRCKDNGKACDYAYWCFNVGPGVEAGVSVAGGMLGPFPGCKCAEDFTGWGIGVEASAGKGIMASIGGMTSSPGNCLGFTLGAGLGVGASVKAQAYCSTTLLGCKD